MKKSILLITVFVFVAGAAFSQSVSDDKDVTTLALPDDETFKLGVIVGYPSGITAGYRFSNWFEANLSGGYNFLFVNSGVLSANTLFTMFNIPIGDAGYMPVSFGPQVNMIFGNTFYLELVADLRMEYTFPDIPLNLFVEGGFGFRFFDDDWIAFNGGVGVRYVFR